MLMRGMRRNLWLNRAYQAPISMGKAIKFKRLGETIVPASGEESSPGAYESRRAVANR